MFLRISLRAASLLSILIITSANANDGDVYANGIVYHAGTYAGHPSWYGHSTRDYVVDINVGGGNLDCDENLFAPDDGTVVVPTAGSGWGRAITWTKADGSEQLFLAHLETIDKIGSVSAGDRIATVGNTGNSITCHLHIERREGALELSGQSIIPGLFTNVSNGNPYTSSGPLSPSIANQNAPLYRSGGVSPSLIDTGGSLIFASIWSDVEDDPIVQVSVRYRIIGSSLWESTRILAFVPDSSGPVLKGFRLQISEFTGQSGLYEFQFQARDQGTPQLISNWSDGGTFQVNGQPAGNGDDFFMSNSSLGATRVGEGESLSATTIQNYVGEINERTEVFMGYYLSNDTVFDVNDILLEDDRSTLQSSDIADNESATLTIPLGTQVGNYFILFVADHLNDFPEVNENNNVEAVAIEIVGVVTTCNNLVVTVDLNFPSTSSNQPTNGNDVILGTNGPDRITALGGNDTICGEGGNDVINAGSGDDWVDGGAGDDEIFGFDGGDVLNGGAGNDEIVAGNGEDLIRGDNGNDVLNGGAADDLVFGGAGEDSIFGQGGDDFLRGEDGDDFIIGFEGEDDIEGGEGNDLLNGGPDDDSVIGGEGNDTLFGLTGNDLLIGGAGNDRVFGQLGNDSVVGGSGDDELFGNEGNDAISSVSGNNVINGGPEGDVISGGSGNDRIFGDGNLQQAGNDFITGGLGADLILGFAGADTIRTDDGVADIINGGPDNDICTTDAIDTVFNCE